MGLAYFFDTYAFIEIIKENPRYLNYLKNIIIVTTKLNLMELHYVLLRTVGKEEAENHYDAFLPFVIEISDEIIKKANEFKLSHKKQNLSYVDCIGYITAKMNNIKFLTGDMQFEKLDNVEYVK
jgi:predicted nucleic acid-binding protein